VNGPQVNGPGSTRADQPVCTSATSGWLRPRAAELLDDPDRPAAGRRIGVLALQGAFAEHATAFGRLGAETVEVRTPAQLATVEALALPGGESTTMSKLLVTSGLFEPLQQRLAEGMPVFGTCAGMILLASDVLDGRPDQRNFAAIDITVRRNGYGRQVDSFEADLVVRGLDAPFHAVFIRAPIIERAGALVDVLATDPAGRPVLVRRDTVWTAAFHPEMTADLRIHRLFIDSLPPQS
jgi:pyridoxal 5'-phosphate synthase pdxT subunit